MFFIANRCHNNVSVWVGKKCNSGLRLWTLLFHKMPVPFAQRSTRSLGATLREIWHSCFVRRGPPSLSRFPVTSGENPFDVKVRSKPTDSVFIWTTWFRVTAKRGNCNRRSKKGEESALIHSSCRLDSTRSAFFPTFEGCGATPDIFFFLHTQLWHVRGIPHFLWLSFSQLPVCHLTQMKCDSLSLAHLAPLPLTSRPHPGGWKCARVATTPAVSTEMCRWCMQGGRKAAASCLPLPRASLLAL